MSQEELFPRTMIEDVSVSRLVIGTNWFLGFSHTSKAKDDFIKQYMTRERIAAVLETFLREGVDTLVGVRPEPKLLDAIAQAEDKVGRKMITITTPHLDLGGTVESEDNNKRILDEAAATGAKICMPHQASTDALCDRRARVIRDMDRYCRMIRDRAMIPGLSTHAPEVIRYADETNLDVATYIQIYNAAGFLMPLEVDWVNRIIWQAKHPVLTIKPLAAGRLQPLVGLAFVWSTIRPIDMVAIGVMNSDEAREVIEISRAVFERRCPALTLQKTRSKKLVE
ncbi:MAG: hypothetical protein D6820_10210 [Lentisphaerae bacterium]|nr:MAG: hypothetical protein D6820_10210 [Lentisphaerota bacterium]